MEHIQLTTFCLRASSEILVVFLHNAETVFQGTLSVAGRARVEADVGRVDEDDSGCYIEKQSR